MSSNRKRVKREFAFKSPKRKTGSDNNKWKGDEASYSAFHYRVITKRGRPQLCEECGVTSGRMTWSNKTGDYPNPDDYRRLCWSCHQRFDCARRIESKTMTSPLTKTKFKHSNRCILTEEQVLEAKRLKTEGATYKQLGSRYSVTPQAIFLAIKGKNWKHLI